MNPELRPATEADLPALAGLIRELAVFEKLEHLMVATPEDLGRHLFGPRAAAEAVVAELDGRVVAFALFFGNFSTFLGKPGLYLEDLYIRPAYRGRGYGRNIMQRLAQIAVERGCGRFEWWVLDWNHPDIEFYRSLGAQPMSDWTVQRVSGEALVALAGAAGE